MAAEKMLPLTLTFSAEERKVLERVMHQQGLENIQQAAEWLAKSALRKAARRTSGRGRALYPVGRNEQ